MISVKNKRFYKGLGEYVGRPSPLGNPFKIGVDGSRLYIIRKYSNWLKSKIMAKDPEVIAELHRLSDLAKEGDLVLLCWCVPKACHAEVIKQYIETFAF